MANSCKSSFDTCSSKGIPANSFNENCILI
jgi:hypothetical protein